MIVPTLARMIVREHLYKPIKGKILTLGRQNIGMTYEQCIELLKQENYPLSENRLNEIANKFDTKTRFRKETNFISDDFFFGLLGINEVHAMDVSHYEGADIIHDLNIPVPDSLKDQFDFIIDGGTFDHLVDILTAFKNVVQMLKSDGRVFQWNAASNFTGAAYISFGPDLFYDYYVLNQFADCKVYVAEVDSFLQHEFWDLFEFEGLDQYGNFISKRIQMTVVLAEKGIASTYDKIPIQAQYREADIWSTYRKGQELLKLSKRKPLVASGVMLKLSRSEEMNFPKRLFSKLKEKLSFFKKRLFSKLKEEGLIWTCRRVIDKIFSRLMRQPDKIHGFKYIGKL